QVAARRQPGRRGETGDLDARPAVVDNRTFGIADHAAIHRPASGDDPARRFGPRAQATLGQHPGEPVAAHWRGIAACRRLPALAASLRAGTAKPGAGPGFGTAVRNGSTHALSSGC